MKKGFTLIELLAVIVILAIIALIATPIVLDIISDTKESALLRSAEFYLDGVEFSVASAKLNNRTIKDGKYNILENGNICLEDYDETTKECNDNDSNLDNNELVVDVNGDKPKSGKITVTNGEISDIVLNLSNKVVIKNEKGELESIHAPKSFEEDSWETIAANVKAGNLSAYNVGDTKKIKLTSEDDSSGNADGITTGLYTIRIANKTNTEDVCTKETNEAGETYSKTACGFVIEFVDIITEHNMNPKGTYKDVEYDTGWNVDGYPASAMYTYIKNDIYNSLPEELRNVIIETTVVSGHGSTTGENNFTTKDKLYLLSSKEVHGTDDLDTSSGLTRQLEYYSNIGVTTDNYSGTIKNYNGSAIVWWLRSAYSNSTNNFHRVNSTGYLTSGNAFSTRGVAVAFRIG